LAIKEVKMDFKSHSKEGIIKAQKMDKPIWYLETDTSGEDDMLVGTYEDVLADILAYHELDSLLDHWSLEKVDWEIK